MMALKIPKAHLILICLIKCEIIQIMELINSFKTDILSIRLLRDRDELRVLSKKQYLYHGRDENEYICFKFNMYREMLSKELAINAILNNFSVGVIRKFKLPKTLDYQKNKIKLPKKDLDYGALIFTLIIFRFKDTIKAFFANVMRFSTL